MNNQSIANQNLKTFNANYSSTASNIKKDSILNYQVTYKKKIGNLSLSLKDKLLTWKSLSDSSVLSLFTDQISEIKKDKKERDLTELLYIKKVDMDKGIVFVFSEENKTEMRDKFYEILIRREDEYEKVFNSLSTFEKKKILYLFTDENISFLYDELVTKKILNKDEFWIFLKKKYTSKITFLNTLQLIQLSRNEELTLFNNPFRNIFDYKIKKKLLLSYDDLNILYETYIKPQKAEDLFWKELIKNQKKYQTELVGGLKPLFFTSEEEKIIEKENTKFTPNNQAQTTEKTSSTANLNIPVLNQAIQKYRISEKFEDIEIHKYYTHKHFGPCYNIAEYDYIDRVIKDSIEKEEFNRKEMNNFISSINDYSKRKMEDVDFISKNNFNCILGRFKAKVPITKNSVYIASNEKKNDVKETENLKEHHKGLRKKLEEMKIDYNRKVYDNIVENKKESVVVFKKINDLILSSSKLDLYPPIKEDLKRPLEELKKKHLLIRDLFFIHQSIKNSTYTEEIKKTKKNNIKRISQEIHDGLLNYERNESLNPVVLANLQIFKEFINKIRGAN